jgi:uncharacterized protein with PhoU and TrkA domain
MGTHPVIAAAVEESDEVVVRLEVAPGAPLSDATLGDRMVRTETGMRVIAVRRGDGADWVVSPGPTTALRAGDVVIAKGTRGGAAGLARLVGAEDPFE